MRLLQECYRARGFTTCYMGMTGITLGVTRVLQGVYRSVTGVLQISSKGRYRYYKGITEVSKGCYKGFIKVFSFYKVMMKKVLHCRYRGFGVLVRCFRGVIGWLHGCSIFSEMKNYELSLK